MEPTEQTPRTIVVEANWGQITFAENGDVKPVLKWHVKPSQLHELLDLRGTRVKLTIEPMQPVLIHADGSVEATEGGRVIGWDGPYHDFTAPSDVEEIDDDTACIICEQARRNHLAQPELIPSHAFEASGPYYMGEDPPCLVCGKSLSEHLTSDAENDAAVADAIADAAHHESADDREPEPSPTPDPEPEPVPAGRRRRGGADE